MNVCFVVPDGTGIRNYLFSNLLQKLHESGASIWIWHTLTPNAINEIRKMHPSIVINDEVLPSYKEALYEKFLRESIAYARLISNAEKVKNETILINWRKNPKTILKKAFFKLAKLYGKYLSKSYNRILQADEKYLQSVNNLPQLQNYKDFLQKIQADSVICTHQRAVNAIPAMQAANLNNIRTVSAIYSWDNMPKARLNTRSKYYIVWSEYMKEEMKIYYPEFDQANIIITGSPQFEFYFNEEFIEDRETFCKKYNLDSTKRIVCYSGDDNLTSPYDPDYLHDLAEEISKNFDDVQILLRRAPVDLTGRFDAVVKQFPDIIKVSDPLWNFDGGDKTNWTLVYPSMKDVALLVNTAYHCDFVYNVGSTMAHDFAMFNKPAIYINYNQKHSVNWSIDTIYKYQHFRSKENLEAVVLVNSKKEIAHIIDELLKKPLEIAKDRVKWLNVISQFRKESSSIISDLLLSGK